MFIITHMSNRGEKLPDTVEMTGMLTGRQFVDMHTILQGIKSSIARSHKSLDRKTRQRILMIMTILLLLLHTGVLLLLQYWTKQ